MNKQPFKHRTNQTNKENKPIRLKQRASPGIEPGPPVPETGILPLNYGAIYDKYKSNIEINRRNMNKQTREEEKNNKK